MDILVLGGTQPAQVLDSRDLAALVAALLEQDRGGVFTRSGRPSRSP